MPPTATAVAATQRRPRSANRVVLAFSALSAQTISIASLDFGSKPADGALPDKIQSTRRRDLRTSFCRDLLALRNGAVSRQLVEHRIAPRSAVNRAISEACDWMTAMLSSCSVYAFRISDRVCSSYSPVHPPTECLSVSWRSSEPRGGRHVFWIPRRDKN